MNTLIQLFISACLITWATASVGAGQTAASTAATNPKEVSVPAEKAKVEPMKIQGVVVQEVSGIVRMIRSNPETEVFFKDLKSSLIIPQGPQHNAIFKACEKSQKTNTPVSLMVDNASRRIMSLPGDSLGGADSLNASSESAQ